jgi:septum formation protein
MPSGVDEKSSFLRSSYIVRDIAYKKGLNIFKKYLDSLVLSADTLVVLKRDIISKPIEKI